MGKFFNETASSYNTTITVPSPIGGLNARDSLAMMPPNDAIILNNWWPQPYGCLVRKGYFEWTTGLPAEVETLATWSSITGAQKLFAWSFDSMYDITTRGVAGAAILGGLTNARWQWVNQANTAGSNLIAVNGLDNAITYTEAGLGSIVLGVGGPGEWAGLDPKDAIQLTVHQNRLWAVQKDSSLGWYLPDTGAIFGIMAPWDFGPVFKQGGFLQYLTTWTIDDGNGAEDHLVAMSSRGECVVYGGTDPTDPLAWHLQGVYNVGAPVSGRRSFDKAAGDVIVLTQQGVVSMAKQLVSTKVSDARQPITSDKIQFLLSELTSQFSPLFGWELKYFPKLNMVLINVPSVTVGGDLQLAANQITNAWCQFSGMVARCWTELDSNPFFGSVGGKVYCAWQGDVDGMLLDNTGGTGIAAQVQQAYNYYQQLATQKQVSMYRPVFSVEAPITVNSKILYDFATEYMLPPTPIGAVFASLWDAGLWDTATWSGGFGIQKHWIQAIGMGVAASIRMATLTETETLWVSTDYSLVGGKGLF